jgi:hypothetical protein
VKVHCAVDVLASGTMSALGLDLIKWSLWQLAHLQPGLSTSR